MTVLALPHVGILPPSPFASLRPPASLRGTLRVAKWLELREALRAGLCVRRCNGAHGLHDLRNTRAIGVFENRRKWYRDIGRSDSYDWGFEILSESFLDAGRDFCAHPAGFRAFFNNDHTAGLFH